MANSLGILFTKLNKFTGDNDSDLTDWLRNFERCCVIAKREDALVKGKLLMLFVEGQAKAVLEEYEEEKGAPQEYNELADRLKAVFDTTATREAKNVDV